MKPDEILSKLKQNYPQVKCALNHNNAYELAVSTILSAQCTDERVNTVTSKLFEKYPDVRDLAEANIEEVRSIIRPTGFYNAKAKNIIGFAKGIVDKFNGIVPETLDELIKLPGVARKTANVILGVWYKKSEGIAVDTHVRRLSKLLGLTLHEKDLMKVFPECEWDYISLALIQYGRDYCNARKHDTSKCFLGGH